MSAFWNCVQNCLFRQLIFCCIILTSEIPRKGIYLRNCTLVCHWTCHGILCGDSFFASVSVPPSQEGDTTYYLSEVVAKTKLFYNLQQKMHIAIIFCNHSIIRAKRGRLQQKNATDRKNGGRCQMIGQRGRSSFFCNIVTHRKAQRGQQQAQPHFRTTGPASSGLHPTGQHWPAAVWTWGGGGGRWSFQKKKLSKKCTKMTAFANNVNVCTNSGNRPKHVKAIILGPPKKSSYFCFAICTLQKKMRICRKLQISFFATIPHSSLLLVQVPSTTSSTAGSSGGVATKVCISVCVQFFDVVIIVLWVNRSLHRGLSVHSMFFCCLFVR